jgi:hypothetical protein
MVSPIHKICLTTSFKVSNWLCNRIFENYYAILDAACDAWNRLLASPDTSRPIGWRDRAQKGRKFMLLVFRA